MSQTKAPQKGFLAAVLIAVQIVLLGGLWIHANYPHYVGKKVLLGIRPVDPRSLMRGQFVRLDYEINLVSRKLKSDDMPDFLPVGTDVYVSLEPGNPHWTATKISTLPPTDSTYIQGRVRGRRSEGYQIRYGIEAYFAAPERAKRLERDFRDRQLDIPQGSSLGAVATAEIMLAPNGQSSLVNVVVPN